MPSLTTITKQFAKAVDAISFDAPITHIYNPLIYAWRIHQRYLQRYGSGSKKIIFLGMNPGPWGMAQTGIPFGEIPSVRDWLELDGEVDKPAKEHPKRPVTGLACSRSEVSGRRLWGAFAERFGQAEAFFAEHFVINYCPLSFMEETGRNFTPDKLPLQKREELFAVCDSFNRQIIKELQAEWVIGVGGFAKKRAEIITDGMDLNIGQILHPSPASPAANRGWDTAALKQMREMGLWD